MAGAGKKRETSREGGGGSPDKGSAMDHTVKKTWRLYSSSSFGKMGDVFRRFKSSGGESQSFVVGGDSGPQEQREKADLKKPK